MTRKEYLKKLIQVERNKPKKQQTATVDKYPQGYFKEKQCKHCGNIFKPNAPSELYCSEFCRSYAVTENYYKRVYGLSIKEYLDIAERQSFVCAICGQENFPMKDCSTGLLVVDHDHITDEVRGLLCHNCNRALGLLKDNTEVLSSAINYLESVTTNCRNKRSEAVEQMR